MTIITTMTIEGGTAVIFLLAGTSDARELACLLQQEGYPLVASVVTESAADSLREAGVSVRVGRLTAAEMVAVLKEQGAAMVVDASHPFAEEASKNAIQAAENAGIPYLRYERPEWKGERHPLIETVSSYQEAAEAAARRKGVVMLTTGSKTLDIFVQRLLSEPGVRLVARMLPRKDNMEKCERLGLEQKNIIAMQGPFGKELNKVLYQHYKVTTVITKESGQIGSVDEKVEAALELGLHVVLISRPRIEYGRALDKIDQVLDQVRAELGGMSHE
jgi:precorrin-6A/cobalt-precorrin-6A reductase